MRIAFSIWEQRIAPVFDTARQIHLVDTADGRVVAESTRALSGGELADPVSWLRGQGVATLVCGALSRPLQNRLAAAGVRVVPFVAGALAEVMRAWLDGSLGGAAFTMPGCCGRRRMRRKRREACGCSRTTTI